MIRVLLTFSILSFLILTNCCKEEDPPQEPQINYTNLGIVTGLDLYDANGNPIGRWKSPNHKPGNISAFPIPNSGSFSVYSQDTLIRIWLVPAECLNDTITVDIPELSESLNYPISRIDSFAIRDIPLTDFNNQINLNFSTEGPGFYKLFSQLKAGTIFWQNLYIDPDFPGFPSFETLDSLCE